MKGRMVLLRITLFLLFLSTPTLGIHMEAHCGKKWVTFYVIGYEVAGEYEPHKEPVLTTLRKSQIKRIHRFPGSGVKVILKSDTSLAYYIMQESHMAIIQCLE